MIWMTLTRQELDRLLYMSSTEIVVGVPDHEAERLRGILGDGNRDGALKEKLTADPARGTLVAA